VQGHREERRAPRYRYLTTEELARLSAAVDAYPNRASAEAISVMLLTGARKGEVLSMRWQDLDLGDAPMWTKPAASTKQARLHRVPLSAEACALLLAIKERAAGARFPSPYVFPQQRRRGRPAIGNHLPDVRSARERIVKAAGLEDLRIHDLRHYFVSILASQELSLPMIGALLGHTQAAATNRDAHLMDDAQRPAAECVSQVVKFSGGGK
jgi:integrase